MTFDLFAPLTRLGLAAVLLVPTAALAAEPQAPAETMVPHRAVYDLSLATSRERAGVRNVSGRLVYEFEHQDCRFVLTYRQAMSMTSGEGRGGVLDFLSVSDEDYASNRFVFETQSTVSGAEPTRIAGEALRPDTGPVRVTLREPDARTTEVAPAVLFPTQHVRQVLAAAQKGEFTLPAEIYDGGDPADVASPSVTFIGNPRPPGHAKGDLPASKIALDTLRSWPVTVSYFDAKEPASEQTPKFVMNADLYENGVSGSMTLDYGTFVVNARLVSLEELPAGRCTQPQGG
jgi:hypothetical protein